MIETLPIANAAAEMGYDRLWIADQRFHADPFVTLAWLAQEVAIPLGLAVTNPFTRHPVQIARAIASLVSLYPQARMQFALGTSNPRQVLRPLGLAPRNRDVQVSRALTMIRTLLEGQSVTQTDENLDFRSDDVALDLVAPRTVPKLFVGTRGPKMLAAAADTADGIMIEAVTRSEPIEWMKSVLASEREVIKPPLELISWQLTEVLLGGEEPSDEFVEFARGTISNTSPDMRARLGFDSPEVLAGFGGSGTPEELIGKVLRMSELGFSSWCVVPTGSAEEIIRTLNRFAEHVIRPLHQRMSSSLHEPA